MMKTILTAAAVILGAAAPATPLMHIDAATAEQTVLNLPDAEAVIAQFSYLELSHDETGLSLAVTDTSAVFIDLAFPGEFHIRIGF